jgi:signal peptidase I
MRASTTRSVAGGCAVRGRDARGEARRVCGRAGLALLACALVALALSSCGGGGHADIAAVTTTAANGAATGGGDGTAKTSTANPPGASGDTQPAGVSEARADSKDAGSSHIGTAGAGGTGSASAGGKSGKDANDPKVSKDGTGAQGGHADETGGRHKRGSGSHGAKGSAGSGAVPAAGTGSAAAGSGSSTESAPARETYEVRSLNMEPTYKPYVKLYYDTGDTTPAVDQVVVFRMPTAAIEGSCGENPPPGHACQEAAPGLSSTLALGRVVAGGGESVAFQEGNVIRNGQPQNESFTSPCGSGPVCTFSDPITVPQGSYYILFDNRSQVDDSRVWGAVPQAAIVGVVNGVAGSS